MSLSAANVLTEEEGSEWDQQGVVPRVPLNRRGHSGGARAGSACTHPATEQTERDVYPSLSPSYIVTHIEVSWIKSRGFDWDRGSWLNRPDREVENLYKKLPRIPSGGAP